MNQTKASGHAARVAFAGMLFASAMFGQQSSGSLRGTIKDGQGGVVPGAKVTLTDVAQGDNREVITGAEGIFSINLATHPRAAPPSC
jgi:hypothetical protein